MAEPFKLSSFLLYRKEDLKPISASELSRRLNPSAEEFAPMARRARSAAPPGESLPEKWMQGRFSSHHTGLAYDSMIL